MAGSVPAVPTELHWSAGTPPCSLASATAGTPALLPRGRPGSIAHPSDYRWLPVLIGGILPPDINRFHRCRTREPISPGLRSLARRPLCHLWMISLLTVSLQDGVTAAKPAMPPGFGPKPTRIGHLAIAARAAGFTAGPPRRSGRGRSPRRCRALSGRQKVLMGMRPPPRPLAVASQYQPPLPRKQTPATAPPNGETESWSSATSMSVRDRPAISYARRALRSARPATASHAGRGGLCVGRQGRGEDARDEPMWLPARTWSRDRRRAVAGGASSKRLTGSAVIGALTRLPAAACLRYIAADWPRRWRER